MSGQGSCNALFRWLLALVVTTSSGCIGFLHPVAPLPTEFVEPCQVLPNCCRSHVYIFLINGLDPGNYCNMTGVRDYLHTLGFIKTYYGQLYHAAGFEKEICRLHETDPDARFVLIGFSYGANMARSITQDVKAKDIHIDLLVYLGGNTMTNTPRDKPENAGQIVNILATGCVWNGATIDGAENVNLPDVWHFGSPSHPYSLEVLARELAEVASHVEVVEEGTPPPPAAEPGEWDFLKPMSRLKPAR